MTSTGTIPPTFKAKKLKIKGKRKRPEAVASSTLKERLWVWDHFTTIDKPIFEIIDKKKVRVGIKKRAKCNYYSIDLACDSYGNGTSTLKRHIKDVCKLYLGILDLEKGQQVSSTGVEFQILTTPKCLESPRGALLVEFGDLMDESQFDVFSFDLGIDLRWAQFDFIDFPKSKIDFSVSKPKILIFLVLNFRCLT